AKLLSGISSGEMYGRSFPSLCQLYFSLHFGVQTEILSKNQNSNLGLYKFIEGGLGFDELTPEKVQEYVRFANAAASLCIEKEGAIPALATLEEVLKRLNQR
ncbi:MAG: hypothetical protein SPE30_03670, partial [Candidatus Treponema excrementipullorum]|nr:hypothetical protein [Candidatus Treponema excrementipullorum]